MSIIRIFLYVIIVFSLAACTNDNSKSLSKMQVYDFASDQKSQIFILTVDGNKVPLTVVPNVDSAEALRIAQQYKMLPSYCWIESRYITVHYAHIALDHNPHVELSVNQPIKKFTIYPKMLGIKAVVDGNMLRFNAPVDLNSYFIISINELSMFVLMAESLETDIPDLQDHKVVNLNEFMDNSKLTKDYSDVIKRAIDSINGTGKTLYIPKGEYLTDEIVIQNCRDLNIYLDAGALIRIKTSPSGQDIQNRGIWIDHSEQIRVYGRGVLDHQGYENFKNGRNDYHYGFPGYDFYFKFKNISENDPFLQSPVLITYSKNVLFEGLVLRNSRNYNFNVRHSDFITIKDIKIITPAGSVPENTDGINVGSVHNMLIDNCLVYCNDDPFAFGHNLLPYDNRSVKNLTIRKMTGWNPRANGMRLGWAMNTYAGDILFSDCHFSGMDDSAILIHKHQSDNSMPEDSLCYRVVRFEDCSFDDIARETRPMIEVQGVCMKSLEFVRVAFDTVPKFKPVILGDKKRKIGKLLLEDVTIAGEKVSSDNIDFEMRNIGEIIIK